MAVTAAAELLEREAHLELLQDALAAAQQDHGRLVLVSGEAGVGKTALIQRFATQVDGRARVLTGACDALFTPRPLGPIADIAEQTGGPLAEMLEQDARPYQISAVLLDELRLRPTALVLEDLHWGDEATLDVLRLLGRRIQGTHSVVVASYRDDELSPDHPLRVVIGSLGGEADVERVQLPPLSPAAVAELASPHDVDADELYRLTSGNPFFVTETLASGASELPATVRDAVLARAARLDPDARALLDAVSIVPPQAELGLLEGLAGSRLDRLDSCLAAGMLVQQNGAIAFRHELARIAVEESMSPHRRVRLHRAALDVLVERGSDEARLAHHAEACGNAEAVIRFAPGAAEQAIAAGAHREAAAQFERALRFGNGLPPERRAELLERGGHERYLVDRFEDAIEWLEEAVEIWRAQGNRVREGDALRQLSKLQWCGAHAGAAVETIRHAVEVLEQCPPGRELAAAYGSLAYVELQENDLDKARSAFDRALELADRFDDTEVGLHALNTIGWSELCAGDPAGREKLVRSLELAERAGLDEHIGRAYIHLADIAQRNRDYELADRYIPPGVEYCSERGLDLWVRYLHIYRARTELDRGRWDAAIEAIPPSVVQPGTPLPRIVALVVVGLVRARRGDPGQWEALDEAAELANASAELEWLAPTAAARAEAFWLSGKTETAAAETEVVLRACTQSRAIWWAGELAYWRRRCGVVEDAPPGVAEPWAQQLAGDWEGAAASWRVIGCPYEEALALAEADDEEPLRRSLELLQQLDAGPPTAHVARRLRERGARRLPRGPRRTTRANAGGLTRRELEVLSLVVRGLHNRQIAERLFLSERTVEHHVSAILRKLGVSTRGRASVRALQLGLCDQDR